MSQFTYNDISLQLIKTNSVERVVRSSDDGVDYMWTVFTLDLSCIYNPAATSYDPEGTQNYGNLPMVTDAAIRHYLMQKRRSLIFEEGGIQIINLPPTLADGGTIDCDNGPDPISCTITRIASSRLFFINYVIKTSVIECPDGSFPSPIASSRYTRTEQIDDQYRSTLITSGVTYFRANVLAALAADADSFRSYIIPPLLSYYKRLNVTFNLRSDGLAIEWSITDVEQFQDLGSLWDPTSAAGIGITKMTLKFHSGNFTSGPNGMVSGPGSMCTVICGAWGPRGADRYQMTLFCIKVAFQKMSAATGLGAMPISAEIDEDCFEQFVQVKMSFILISDSLSIKQMAVPFIGVVGNQVLIRALRPQGGINPQPPYDSGTRGTAGYFLAVNNFIEVCFANLSNFNDDDTGTIIPPNEYKFVDQVGNGPGVFSYGNADDPTPPNANTPVRQQGNAERGTYNDQNIYGHYTTKSNYIMDEGVIQLPLATGTATNNQGPVGNAQDMPTSVNIQLFQPAAKKVVEWSITRIGAVPEVLDPTVPTAYATDYTLLRRVISPMGMDVMPDGATPIYRISGTYTYSVLNPPGPTDPIQFDTPPWLTIQPSDTTQIQGDDYEEGIINNPTNGLGV